MEADVAQSPGILVTPTETSLLFWIYPSLFKSCPKGISTGVVSHSLPFTIPFHHLPESGGNRLPLVRSCA